MSDINDLIGKTITIRVKDFKFPKGCTLVKCNPKLPTDLRVKTRQKLWNYNFLSLRKELRLTLVKKGKSL